MIRRTCLLISLAILGCDDDEGGVRRGETRRPTRRRRTAHTNAASLDAAPVGATPTDAALPDAGPPDAAPVEDAGAPGLVVVTFNTGSTPDLPHDRPPDDGYGQAEADLTDAHYGSGLAWRPFVDDTRRFFADLDPDIVVFQEVFWPGDCPAVPAEARVGFVCEDWTPGDPTVAERVLGPDYQVACHPGHPDKCAAVHRRVGTFRGCDAPFCLEGLTGGRVEGCGRGARVARGVIDRVDGGTLTLVNVHGTSGISRDDQACRTAQVEQVFVDLGDGRPAADGAVNLVMGDLNTDPGRLTGFDASADRWLDFVGPEHAFHWLTAIGPTAPRTYGGAATIDHVVSDTLTGPCTYAGAPDGPPLPTEAVFFDHVPIVCTLR
ncbi:MAG: hypothetical protein H6704_13370 [Myxococcales bacterium]|nr:hypothetical protein [Myxococcales bacterium]